MSEEEGFLRAIQENPEDVSLRLVYADWLEDRGDLRAEYLRLEQQLPQILSRLGQLRAQIDPEWRASVSNQRVQAHLRVVRGLPLGIDFRIYEGENYLGRADELAVDIDLADLEPPDRIWSSRQHALIRCANGALTIEDLNTANGTYVNRERVFPGQPRRLEANDVIQVGTVQMRVLF